MRPQPPHEIPAGLRLPLASPCPEATLLARERASELRAAISRLPARCATLLAALLDDPLPDYAALAARLRVPRGSLGPTRSHCLACLRRRLSPQER